MSKPSEKRSLSAADVLREMEHLCASLRAGDRFPGRQALMQQFDASERAVTGALDELARQGKIIKRMGRGGCIVAEPGQEAQGGGNGLGAGLPSNALPNVATGDRTVLAITEPDGNIFDQAMQMLMKQAKAANWTVACHLVSRGEVPHIAAPPVSEGIRNYLVIRRENLPLAERLHQAGHRVVLVGTPFTNAAPQVPVVSGDQEHGGYLAMKHLIDLGHRRIAIHMLGDGTFDFHRDYVNVPRWVGSMNAIEEARGSGLDIELQILAAEFGGDAHGQVIEWGRDPDKVCQYFASPTAPTAVASWNDDMAIRLLTQLQRAGVRVPEDVSLVGYDNQARGASIHPSLTTVDGLLDQQIRTALRLLGQPQSPASNHSVVVLPTLIQRESTAPIS